MQREMLMHRREFVYRRRGEVSNPVGFGCKLLRRPEAVLGSFVLWVRYQGMWMAEIFRVWCCCVVVVAPWRVDAAIHCMWSGELEEISAFSNFPISICLLCHTMLF